MNQPVHIVKGDLINLRFSSLDVLHDQVLLNQREKIYTIKSNSSDYAPAK